jgi:ATP-dependent exoDNAse (exonuclease V) beta subunit
MGTEAKHLVIRASAGSGKTFQLATRYLQRVAERTPPDEMLATTFTRKAAGEILDRVLVTLAEAACDEEEARKLAGRLQSPGLDRPACAQLLLDLVRQMHRLQVGTLDSFFVRLATHFTLELGLPPGWQIIDELQDQQLRLQAIGRLLREEKTGDVARLASMLAKGDATRSVSGLIRQTVDNFYELYCETDEAAWRPLPELRRLSNDKLAEAIEAARHVELPADRRIAKQRDKDLEFAVAANWEAFMGGGIGGTLLNEQTTYYGKPLSGAVQAAYGQLLNHAKAVLLQELAAQIRATRQLLERFDAVYQQLKRTSRGLRFEDVTHRLRRLFEQEDPQRFAYRLDGHIAHLLLDEFQDTSPAQWHVLRPFAKRITAAETGRSFLCVGDAKQSIYAWRGGVAEIFDSLDAELHGLASESLSKSYRSSQPVINTVNRIFAGLARHPHLEKDERAVRTWCQRFETHTTDRTELPGYACVTTAAARESDEEELSASMLRTTAEGVADIVRNAPFATVGVLLRTNEAIGQLMDLLRERGVPASEEGGNPITDSAVVLTIVSLLQLADHPGDTVARFHVTESPLGAPLSLEDARDDTAAARLAAEVRQQLIAEGYAATVQHWCRLLEPFASDRDLLRMGQLIELATRFDAQATLRPSDFIRLVRYERFFDPSADRVRVMTIHAAKGLEFDVVFTPLIEANLVSHTPPFVTGRTSPAGAIERVCLYRNQKIQRLLPREIQEDFTTSHDQEVREALCRLYVALTRPKHALHVILPPPSDKEKTLPRNPAGLIRAALTDGSPLEPGQIVYEDGDRQWHQRVAAEITEPVDADRVAPAVTLPPVRLAEMAGGRRRGLARAAPSRHASHAAVRLGDVLREPDAAALNRGTVVHAWLEQIDWLDERMPSDDQLKVIAMQSGISEAEAGELLGAFHRMLEAPAIQCLLSRVSYRAGADLRFPPPVVEELLDGRVETTVRCEHPIAYRSGGELVTGSIDRLVLCKRGGTVIAADVIDFKTDAVMPALEPEWSQRIEGYRPQLAAYAEAVASTYGLPADRLATRLAFVQPRVVVDFHPRPLESPRL